MKVSLNINKNKTNKIESKTITLILKDIERFKKDMESFFKKSSKFEILNKNNELIISIPQHFQKKLYSVIAKYLLSVYIDKLLKKYNQYIETLKNILLDDNYFLDVTTIEVERYFKYNNILSEDAFLIFNMFGFEKEVQTIYEEIKYKETQKEEFNELRERILNKGINLEDYKILKAEIDENGVYLLNLKNEKITQKNMAMKFNIKFDGNKFDEWTRDILFCSVMCIILKTKKLYINKDYEELYEDLICIGDLQDNNTEIILES